MKLTLTFEEIMNRGLWGRFCKITGTDEWCMNEGTANPNTEYTFTEKELEELGIKL